MDPDGQKKGKSQCSTARSDMRNSKGPDKRNPQVGTGLQENPRQSCLSFCLPMSNGNLDSGSCFAGRGSDFQSEERKEKDRK